MPADVYPASTIPSDELRAHVVSAWHGPSVIAHGEAIFPADLPGFVAIEGGRIVGHASYRIAGDACELASIEADPPRAGVGSALLEAVVEAAREARCASIWLTTTNDNLDALRFYQGRGFRLRSLRPGAVDVARESLKPEIPEVGSSGILMRDELDLEMRL